MDGGEYCQWLHNEVRELREPFTEQISRAVSAFNKATWPKDLGLSKKKYPFRIWRKKQKLAVLDESDVVSVGEVLEHASTVNARGSANQVGFDYCFVIAFTETTVLVQPAGQSEPVEVERSALKRCRGAGVVVPGPLKLVQRCRDKIAVDYEKEPWPPAASLCDIGRCSVVLEDPYAMAVIVEYLKQEFTVLRVKNRFHRDNVEVNICRI